MAYHAAYLAVNAHIRALRTASAREVSTEYIVDGGGDVVEFGAAIAAIINGGDKWTPVASVRLTRQAAAYYGRALRGALATCTPAQQQRSARLSGYSQAQIAARTGRQPATVCRNVAIIREKLAAYIDEKRAALMGLRIDAPAVQAAANSAATEGRTAAGKAKHDADAAARMRAYRARKAAARAVARAALEAAAADAADAAAREAAAQARAAADAAAQARRGGGGAGGA